MLYCCIRFQLILGVVQLSSPPTGDTPLQKLPWPPEDRPHTPNPQADDGAPAAPPSPYEGAPEPLMDRVATFLQVLASFCLRSGVVRGCCCLGGLKACRRLQAVQGLMEPGCDTGRVGASVGCLHAECWGLHCSKHATR